ncbi:MAG: polysaccharide deacetylase family protein [Solirubrobacteraceae bacterium]
MSDVLVLCYHAVSPHWDSPLAVTPEAFERQIGHFVSRGWQGTTFSQAALMPPSSRTLAITFDDAYASVMTHAAPILCSLGVPATVFAPTSSITAGRLSWSGVEHWSHTSNAPELTPMSWQQLGELADRGWEIGSHTRTHPHLTQLADEQLMLELEGSRDDCAERIGRPPVSIAYPYGDVDLRVASRAVQAGYRAGAALSSQLDRLGPYRHPRVGIYRADSWWRFRLKASRSLRELRASPVWNGRH